LFPRDGQRYIAAHAALRSILACYLGAEPGSIDIVAGQHGKPALNARVHGAAAPAFNLSHSDRHAALAVARDGCIGVDLESPRPGQKRSMMLDMLAPGEREAASALDDTQLPAAFRIAWTRKEACLKAVGTGFAMPPQAIYVGLDAGPRTVQLPAHADLPEAAAQRAVHVVTLQSPAGVPTSLARVGQAIGKVRMFRYPPLA
jgi:4'-phosphopantetheinyl transferase